MDKRARLTDTAYLKAKGKGHIRYKYYTELKKSRYCCKRRSFYLGNGADWNDVKDSKKNVSASCFSMCMSYSTCENVAMWMLYGGINGQGTMIDINGSKLKKLVESTETVKLGRFDDNEFVSIECISKDDFEICLIDMVYYERKTVNGKRHYLLTRQEEHEKSVTEHNFEKIKQFAKTYPWHYECECRLVIKIAPEYNDFIKRNKITDIELPFGDDFDLHNGSFELYAAPNFNGEIPDDYEKSALTDELSWDLCKECTKRTKSKE